MTSTSLAELPAEVRNNIYEYVLPRGVDVRLMLAPVASTSHNDMNRDRQLQLDTTPGVAPCDECQSIIKTTCALMQTCSKVHDELAPQLYTFADVMIVELPAATRFVNNIPARFQPLVKELGLAHAYDVAVGEKAEKLQLQSIVQNLTGLRQFYWKGLNRMADWQEKGTEWKPHELRKIKTVLKHSMHLIKVYFDTHSCICCTALRFTDLDGVAKEYVSMSLPKRDNS